MEKYKTKSENIPEPQYDFDDDIEVDITFSKFKNSKNILEGKISHRNYDSDREIWLYHVSVNGNYLMFVSPESIRIKKESQ